MNNKWLLIGLVMSMNVQAIPGELQNAEIIAVTDGDTISVDIGMLPENLQKIGVRIRGVDTPELHRPKCRKEYELAKTANEYTKSVIETAEKTGTPIRFMNPSWDKYGGRLDADVYIGDKMLKNMIIEQRLGIEYDGGKKNHDWCKE